MTAPLTEKRRLSSRRRQKGERRLPRQSRIPTGRRNRPDTRRVTAPEVSRGRIGSGAGLRWLRGPASGCEPGLAELAALLFGGAPPDARLLVRGQCELQAGLDGLTRTADPLGRLDLLERRPGGSDREEEVRLGVATGRHLAPVFGIPFDR